MFITCKMSVDKFGRYSHERAPKRGPPGHGFTFTHDGHYNIENKLLKNVNNPTDQQDAATKDYVDNTIDGEISAIDKMLQKHIVTAKNEVDKVYIEFKKVEAYSNEIRKHIDSSIQHLKTENRRLSDSISSRIESKLLTVSKDIDRIVDDLKNYNNKINGIISAVPPMIDSKLVVVKKDITTNANNFIMENENHKQFREKVNVELNTTIERLSKLEKAVAKIE